MRVHGASFHGAVRLGHSEHDALEIVRLPRRAAALPPVAAARGCGARAGDAGAATSRRGGGKSVATAAGLFHCGKGSKLFCTMALEQNFLLNQVLPFYPGGGSGAILTLSQNPCTNVSSANYTLCCRRLPPSHRLAAPCPRPAPRRCPRHRLCA